MPIKLKTQPYFFAEYRIFFRTRMTHETNTNTEPHPVRFARFSVLDVDFCMFKTIMNIIITHLIGLEQSLFIQNILHHVCSQCIKDTALIMHV